MKKLFYLLLTLSTVATSCGQFSSATFSDENIDANIMMGNFEAAEQLIKLKMATLDLDEATIWKQNFKIEQMERIVIDFNKDDTTITKQLKKLYPETTPELIDKWEKSGALEYLIINGEKRYFRNAARNVFRIDPEAKALYEKANGREKDELGLFLHKYLSEVVKASPKNPNGLSKPVNFKIRYSLSVKPDMVPDGEIIRVWLPYLQKNIKYKNVKLIATSQPNYIIAPDGMMHKSLYMEKRAVAGERTEFWYELSYTGYSQWFNFKPEDIKPYDTKSELYKKYTAERETHIIFSDRIKSLTDSLIAGESNPYLKARTIWTYICDHYPWASAREYSTIPNIPEYVLSTNHGDCGQVGLLFITMARYAGIPARWQSGWMLHPGDINLHDWAETYYEGIGWVSVDQSFGRMLIPEELANNERRGYTLGDVHRSAANEDLYYFFTKGMDAYRFIVNDDYSEEFFPAKIYPRSETVDFQRGEVEWRGGNLYFNCWNYNMEVL